MKSMPPYTALSDVEPHWARAALDEHLDVTGIAVTIFRDAVPQFVSGLAVAIVLAVVGWYIKRWRNPLRQYTLLNSVDADGNPVLHVTTRCPGTVVTRDVGSGPERFEPTDVELPGGTYVAEPMDRYV
ncbi:hypothetical protein ACIRP2_37095 [Streptomyces sp. NPDC101194]|uniref:hypothetical protein n=1 Tax=Streptomyces sp. NPDC101194 TaxID=3366127 RepID=UPI0038093FFD